MLKGGLSPAKVTRSPDTHRDKGSGETEQPRDKGIQTLLPLSNSRFHTQIKLGVSRCFFHSRYFNPGQLLLIEKQEKLSMKREKVMAINI